MALLRRVDPPAAPVARLADDPAFAAAATKLHGLEANLAELDQEIDTLDRELRAASIEDEVAAAARLLETGTLRDEPTTADRLQKLRGRHRVLARAIELQRLEVDVARRAASPAIIEAVRPTYAAVIKRLSVALLELAAAAQAEADIRDDLRSQGIAFADKLRPLPFSLLEDPRNPYSPLAMWHREATEFGVLATSAVPSELRAKWGLRS